MKENKDKPVECSARYTTIKATAKRLKHLQKNCPLTDPESVKTFVARKKCGNVFIAQPEQTKRLHKGIPII